MREIARAFCRLTLCASAVMALSAEPTFSTLYSFCAQTNCTDGENSSANLVQATNGELYGTTAGGGANGGGGTIFKITLSGKLATLYSFCAETGCADGSGPLAGLIQATNGDLYGTTAYGGANSQGTIFKITSYGKLTTLYSFCAEAGCTDGQNPFSTLIQASDGDLYGTTSGGGVHDNGGTIFKVTPNGALTTLYRFCAQTPETTCPDGFIPIGGLVQATNGDFYGTTEDGGSNRGGTIFKITPTGTLTTLYNFCSQSDCTDGSIPQGALIQASNGDLYGTTPGGGANGRGTVFKITPDGALTTLYSFFCSPGDCADGEEPLAGLIQATNGDLYGTTDAGAAGGGTIFKITPGGTFTKLHGFCKGACGYDPRGLVQATNGDLYGITSVGGNAAQNPYGAGTIFRLTGAMGPFVETLTTSGKVGAEVKILGTDLTGATSVTFKGIEAEFTIKSSSEIITTVPDGAASGRIQVVTPNGTLESNVPFTVK